MSPGMELRGISSAWTAVVQFDAANIHSNVFHLHIRDPVDSAELNSQTDKQQISSAV